MFNPQTGFLLYFLGIWVGILFILSKIGGWSLLAEKYRDDGSKVHRWRRFTRGIFRYSVAYKGCLWVSPEADGLYLKTGPLFFFRMFHPPLRIPWSAIKSASERKYWWMKLIDLEFTDPPMKISLDAEALKDAGRFLGEKYQ